MLDEQTVTQEHDLVNTEHNAAGQLGNTSMYARNEKQSQPTWKSYTKQLTLLPSLKL